MSVEKYTFWYSMRSLSHVSWNCERASSVTFHNSLEHCWLVTHPFHCRSVARLWVAVTTPVYNSWQSTNPFILAVEDLCQIMMSDQGILNNTPILLWISRWDQGVKSSFQECCVDSCLFVFFRSRTWLFLAYVIAFTSLAGSVGMLVQDALLPTTPSTWTGIAGVLQCFFCLCR